MYTLVILWHREHTEAVDHMSDYPNQVLPALKSKKTWNISIIINPFLIQDP